MLSIKQRREKIKSIARLYATRLEIERYEHISQSLSPKERYEIINNLSGRSCDNCTNGCCTVPIEEKRGVGEDGSLQGSGCFDWQNDYIVGKSKVLAKSDIYELNL